MRRGALGMIVLGALAVIAAAPAAADTPSLILDPTQGPQNSSVRFSGAGFCAAAGCGPVTITFGSQSVATGVEVDSGGRISGTFDVPPTPAGTQRVVARQPDSGLVAISQYFVGPSLPLTSSASPAPPTPTAEPEPPSTAAPESPTESPASTPASPVPTGTPAPTPSPTDQASAAGASQDASGDDGLAWWLVASAGLIAVCASGALVYRRRRRQRV